MTVAQSSEQSPSAETLPATAYRLLEAHGFIEDVHGRGVFHWEAGETITRQVTIELLRSRGAKMEPVT